MTHRIFIDLFFPAMVFTPAAPGNVQPTFRPSIRVRMLGQMCRDVRDGIRAQGYTCTRSARDITTSTRLAALKTITER